MVSYHDFQHVPKILPGYVHATPRDILKWFEEAPPSSRIEFVCGLLRLCSPSELRFFGSCLEELARLHYEDLRELESLANATVEASSDECLSTLVHESLYKSASNADDLSDLDKIEIKHLGLSSLPVSLRVLATNPTLRSELIFRLSLLQSSNVTSANAYFEALVTDKSISTDFVLVYTPKLSSGRNSSCPSSNESDDESSQHVPALSASERRMVDELLLLYTLAAFHPAFTFDHRYRLSACLSKLRVWAERLKGEKQKAFRPHRSKTSPSTSPARHRSNQQPLRPDSHRTLSDKPSTFCDAPLCDLCHLGSLQPVLVPGSVRNGSPMSLADQVACIPSALTSSPGEKGSRLTSKSRRRGRSSGSSGRLESATLTSSRSQQRCCSCEGRSSKCHTETGDSTSPFFVREANNNYPLVTTGGCSASSRSLSSISSLPHSPGSSQTHWSDSSFEFHSRRSRAPPFANHADSSPDELGLVSTKTLTASDGLAILRHLDTPVSVETPHRSHLDDSSPREPKEDEPPNPSRTASCSNSDSHLHFHVSKHSKSIMDYCRVTPKRHSSGSSPISTPPSEDSGSETMACVVSTTSPDYWRPKTCDRPTVADGQFQNVSTAQLGQTNRSHASSSSVSACPNTSQKTINNAIVPVFTSHATPTTSTLTISCSPASSQESISTTTSSNLTVRPTPHRIIPSPNSRLPSGDGSICLHTSSHVRCISSSCPGSSHAACESNEQCKHSLWSCETNSKDPRATAPTTALFSREEFPELRTSPTRRGPKQSVKDWVKSVQSRSTRSSSTVVTQAPPTSTDSGTQQPTPHQSDTNHPLSSGTTSQLSVLVTTSTTTLPQSGPISSNDSTVDAQTPASVAPAHPSISYRFPQSGFLPPTHCWHSGAPPPSVPLFSPALYPQSYLLPHSSGVFIAAPPTLPSTYTGVQHFALGYPQWPVHPYAGAVCSGSFAPVSLSMNPQPDGKTTGAPNTPELVDDDTASKQLSTGSNLDETEDIGSTKASEDTPEDNASSIASEPNKASPGDSRLFGATSLAGTLPLAMPPVATAGVIPHPLVRCASADLFRIALPSVDSPATHFVLVAPPGTPCITPVTYLPNGELDTTPQESISVSDSSKNRISDARQTRLDVALPSNTIDTTTRSSSTSARTSCNSPSPAGPSIQAAEQEQSANVPPRSVWPNPSRVSVSTVDPKSASEWRNGFRPNGDLCSSSNSVVLIPSTNSQQQQQQFRPPGMNTTAPPTQLRHTNGSYPPRAYAQSQPVVFNAGTFNGRPFLPSNFMLYYTPTQSTPNAVGGSFIPSVFPPYLSAVSMPTPHQGPSVPVGFPPGSAFTANSASRGSTNSRPQPPSSDTVTSTPSSSSGASSVNNNATSFHVIATTSSTNSISLCPTPLFQTTPMIPGLLSHPPPPPTGPLTPANQHFYASLPTNFVVPFAPPSAPMLPRGGCYSCGVPGHKAKACPARHSTQTSSSEGTFHLNYAPMK